MYSLKKLYEIALEVNFRKKYDLRNPQENFLEDIVKAENNWQDQIYTEYIIANISRFSGSKTNHTNSKSGANVVYVSPNQLSSSSEGRVLGQYHPLTHTIYIANNLSQELEKFVYFHEEAHSVGIKSERLADKYAAEKTGYMIHRNYDALAA
ncbi:hypothetical protein J4456_01090 [Candidatus Pacearchaeota archaeon]|nr:hypothetical protein [Candidatus Pacearchaeota archaeon]